MLAPEAPLDAYRTDLARDRSREDFGGADTVWLLTAHCLSRLTRSTTQDLPVLGKQCAAALREFTQTPADGEPTPAVEIADLLLVVKGLSDIVVREGADALASGVRAMANRMAEAGALSMAYTTASLTRRVAANACDREKGLLAADQALFARLMGDLDTAEEFYRACEGIGERARDMTILARAYVGRGVVDRVRGNYPRARVFFERALELADTVQATDLRRLAHQGLTICQTLSGNFDRALQHGWLAVQLADGDSRQEVDALLNLAQVCVSAGHPQAALRSYAAILGKPLSPHRMLAGLGGAAIAAAQAGDSAVLARAEAQVMKLIGGSGLPYENGKALYELGVAYAAIGDDSRSYDLLNRAREIAKSRGFFELLHKTEPAEVKKAAKTPAASHLTRNSQSVVDSIIELDVGESGGLLELTHLS